MITAICLILVLCTAGPARAALMLTGAGAGFTLTTAIGGFPTVSYGSYTLVSVGVTSTDKLIAPANGGLTYLFNDVDGQTLSSSVGSATRVAGPGFAMASVGGRVYGSQGLGGGFYRFNNDGSIATMIPVIGATSLFGLWGNTANGQLLASSNNKGLIEIDPSTGSYVVVNPLTGYAADGVTVTPDGATVYIADYIDDEVRGYSLVAGIGFGAEVFNTGFLGHGSDGMGVLAGTCGLAGQIVVNNNDGTVGLINPGNGIETTIASGGNRGDYALADPANGSLLLSQDDQMARLVAPRGCSIGTVTTAAAEPASFGLLVLPLLAFIVMRRRFRPG